MPGLRGARSTRVRCGTPLLPCPGRAHTVSRAAMEHQLSRRARASARATRTHREDKRDCCISQQHRARASTPSFPHPMLRTTSKRDDYDMRLHWPATHAHAAPCLQHAGVCLRHTRAVLRAQVHGFGLGPQHTRRAEMAEHDGQRHPGEHASERARIV